MKWGPLLGQESSNCDHLATLALAKSKLLVAPLGLLVLSCLGWPWEFARDQALLIQWGQHTLPCPPQGCLREDRILSDSEGRVSPLLERPAL